MKINYTSGCICDSLTIDDKESTDLSVDDIKDTIIKALNKINDVDILQEILITIVETGEYKNLGYCDECSDLISSYTLEI